MTPSLYEIVHGPHEDKDGISPIDRSLIGHVALARSCALAGDREGEALYHQGINNLLDLRESDASTPDQPRLA